MMKQEPKSERGRFHGRAQRARRSLCILGGSSGNLVEEERGEEGNRDEAMSGSVETRSPRILQKSMIPTCFLSLDHARFLCACLTHVPAQSMPSYHFQGSENDGVNRCGRGRNSACFPADIVEPIITFGYDVPERVEFDVQDCGIAELQLIRRDVERLESLLRGSSIDMPAKVPQDHSSMFPMRNDDEQTIKVCNMLAACNDDEQAELELAKKMMSEGNHIPGKR
eukprot:765943-Hanusia_phi.AAC.2